MPKNVRSSRPNNYVAGRNCTSSIAEFATACRCRRRRQSRRECIRGRRSYSRERWTDDEPGETYWKIFNGIRLTGMPGFSKTLSETQCGRWLLLANADKLPPAAKADWSRPSERMRRRQLCRLCLRYPPAPGFPSSARRNQNCAGAPANPHPFCAIV